MTAQIKSVLSHHSPRTSPTLSSSPTSPKNAINPNAASSPTITPMMPSSSITSKATDVVPRLRTWRSFQGNLVSASSTTTTSTSGTMGGARSSPLVESFTPMGSGLSIPSTTSGEQKVSILVYSKIGDDL